MGNSGPLLVQRGADRRTDRQSRQSHKMLRTVRKKTSKKQNSLTEGFQRARASMSRDGHWHQGFILWGLITYLVLVFLMGGSSRYDMQSLIVLRPLGVLACGIALLTLAADHLRRYLFLSIIAGLVLTLVGLHLVPLPPEIWQSLPGRARRGKPRPWPPGTRLPSPS